MTHFFLGVGVALLLYILVIFYRLIQGPTVMDRLVAVNVIGTKSILSEIELIQLVDNVFTLLKLPNVVLKINNRKILEGIVETIGIPEKLTDITMSALGIFFDFSILELNMKGHPMFFANTSECISYDLFCAVWSLVNQIVESITVVHILYLAEKSFYWIEIRAVSNIQYWFNI